MVERIIFFYIDAEICIYSTDYSYLSILFICTFFDSSLYWIPDIQRWCWAYLQRSIYWIIKCHSISLVTSSANGLVLSYIHRHCWCHVLASASLYCILILYNLFHSYSYFFNSKNSCKNNAWGRRKAWLTERFIVIHTWDLYSTEQCP